MKKNICFKCYLVLSLLYSTESFAQSIKANINQLNFLTGTWVQKTKLGEMEEIWGKPIGDNMASTFRYVKDGKVKFYEFVVIEQTDSVPVMKIRHFNRGSIGWEDKENPLLMPLTKLTNNEVEFISLSGIVRLTYKRVDPNNMQVILNEKDKQGMWNKETFNYVLSQ